MKFALSIYSFISISTFAINEDTLALNIEKYERVNGTYRTRDSTQSPLTNGYYVLFNKGEGKYEVGKIENSKRAGFWIICNGKYPDLKHIQYCIGDTIFDFHVKDDSILLSYEYRVYHYFPENFDGMFTPNYNSIFMDFDGDITLIGDFKLIITENKGDWMIDLERISSDTKQVNYIYLKKLFEGGG